MSFNPDNSKQAQEVIFSRKAVKTSHPAGFFSDIPAAHCSTHKHLGTSLDGKKKQLYGPFLWMRFNCLKARATSRMQFTFYY